MAYKGRVRPTIALTAADIAADAVGSSEIAAGAVGTSEIASTFDISSKTVTLPAASVTAHVTGFDDIPLRRDIATLALHTAISDNKAAYNLSNAFVDQFEDDTGIDTTSTAQRTSLEYMESSVNTATSANQTIMDGSGHAASVVDAASSGTYLYGSNNWTMIDATPDTDYYGHYNNTTSRLQKTWPTMLSTGSGSVNNQTSGYLNFGQYYGTSSDDIFYAVDVGLANYLSFTITRFIAVRGYAAGNYDFKLYGTNALVASGSTWTLIQSKTTTSHATNDQDTGVFTNTTKYRYYRFAAQNFENSHDLNVQKLRFYGDIYTNVINATGNYTSATQTALASVSTMGIVVLYKNNSGTASLNNDIVVQVSANGGTNYANATLVAGGTFSTGINIAAVSGVAVTAGTTPKYKISFANQASGSKETQVHGVALLY